MTYVFVALLIGAAILAHEWGHLMAAKWVGIPIRRFSIGFGPGLLSWHRGGTEYRLSAVPLGGYVLPELGGEGDYFRIPMGKRAALAAGGPAASLLLPLICYQVIALAGGAWSAGGLILDPMVRLMELVGRVLQLVPLLVSQPAHLSGVVGIVAQGSGFVGASPLRALEFLALMSANLAVLNLLPVPALDGGKILLCALERLHPRFTRLHLPMAALGWVLILALMVYATVMDVTRLI
jgi:regulator of sigma E protease